MYSRSPSRSVTPTTADEGSSRKKGPRSNKRDRVPLSCTECHRRKKKCDRGHPCGECRERGKESECKYMVPLITNKEGVAQADRSKVTNRRRFTTKQNVNISLESVQSLAESSRRESLVPGGWDADVERDSQDILAPTRDFQSGHDTLQQVMPMECRKQRGSNKISLADDTRLVSNFDNYSLEVDGRQTTTASKVPFRSHGGDYHECSSQEELSLSPVEPLSQEYLIDSFAASKSIPAEQSWLKYALKHPPLFSATLFVSAVHLYRESQLAELSTLYYYRHQTIRLANEVMKSGTVEEKTSDEMIMVAVILLYFSISQNVCWKEYEIHLRGIQQMVMIRGGIEMLGMGGVVGGWLKRIAGPWSEGFEYDHFRQGLLEEEREELEARGCCKDQDSGGAV